MYYLGFKKHLYQSKRCPQGLHEKFLCQCQYNNVFITNYLDTDPLFPWEKSKQIIVEVIANKSPQMKRKCKKIETRKRTNNSDKF